MGILRFVFYNTFRYLENAEMIPEIHDDLTGLSFDKLRDFFKITPRRLQIFIVRFLKCLKKLVSMPPFSLTCSPYIYAFHYIAIVRRNSDLPHFSSWLWQNALWGPWKILLSSRIHLPSGKSLSHKAGRIWCSRFSIPFYGGPFVYGLSLGKWAYYWWLRISLWFRWCYLLHGVVGESWTIGDLHFWSEAVCDSHQGVLASVPM